MNRGNAITEGIIWKQLLMFFFPIALGSLFQQLYNTVDAVIVGRYAGTLALAAVGATGSFVNLLFGFFVGMASGATVVLAQFYGAKNERGIHDSVHTGMAMALLAGFAITALGLITAPRMLKLMNVPEDVYAGALTYIRVFFCGMIPLVVYNVGTGILRAMGDSRRPLYFLMVSCAANVVLDLLFVAVFHMGVAGAAIATVISQTISAALVVLCLTRREGAEKLHIRQIRVEFSVIKGILHVGIPGGLQSMMYSLSNMVVQTAVNGFGSASVAAWTALGRIDGIMWLVMGAFGTAVTTFVGQNFGAQKYARMRKSTRVCLLMAAGATLVLSAVILLFGRILLGFFTEDAEVLKQGLQMIKYMCPFYITYVGVEILSGTIRGTGDSVRPVIITALCTCLFRVIWVSGCMKLDASFRYVALTYPISWVLTTCVFAVYYKRGNWLKRRISAMGFIPEAPR